MAVNPENTGAKKTQMFLMSRGKAMMSMNHLIMAEVNMIPG
jgi:hypothetical protein